MEGAKIFAIGVLVLVGGAFAAVVLLAMAPYLLLLLSTVLTGCFIFLVVGGYSLISGNKDSSDEDRPT